MNPFLYDVLRVLRNRGVLLIIILTTLLALTVLSLYNAFAQAGSRGVSLNTGTTVILIMGMIYAFFVPILGIQTGYSTYARDRATGVLESILVRPVTRRDLILSRYLAVIVASAVAVASALLFLDLLNLLETGTALPVDQLAAVFAGLVVESVAFAGILFLIAHLVRSPGAVLGSSVIVFVLIDVVWFFLLLFVGILFSGFLREGSVDYRGIVQLQYADPSGFPLLVLEYVQNGFFGGLFVPPGGFAGVGLTVPGLVVAGLFWSTVPFLVAYWLAGKKD